MEDQTIGHVLGDAKTIQKVETGVTEVAESGIGSVDVATVEWSNIGNASVVGKNAGNVAGQTQRVDGIVSQTESNGNRHASVADGVIKGVAFGTCVQVLDVL